MCYRSSYASPARRIHRLEVTAPFTSVMSPSHVTGSKSRKRKSLPIVIRRHNGGRGGRDREFVGSNSRGYPRPRPIPFEYHRVVREQYVPAELGHLPPEVDKRDEGFIERRKGGRRASRLSLLFLTSEVSFLVLT